VIRARAISLALSLVLLAPVVATGLLSFSGSEGMDFYANPSSASLRWWTVLLTDTSWAKAFGLSLAVASLSTTAAVAIAAPAVSLWRVTGSPFIALAMTLAGLAFLVPGVIIAVGLYTVFVRAGLFDTIGGLALAHLSVTLPVVVYVLRQRLGAADTAAWSVARSLGAGPPRALLTWLMADHRPTLAAATAAAFMTSLSEATITLFVTDTRVVTLPRRVVSGLAQDIDPSGYAAMLLWFGGVFLVTCLLRRRPQPAQGA
jgi:putative spermidine/putrescine transport system permease protein